MTFILQRASSILSIGLGQKIGDFASLLVLSTSLISMQVGVLGRGTIAKSKIYTMFSAKAEFLSNHDRLD
jgi:hypothetical protein